MTISATLCDFQYSLYIEGFSLCPRTGRSGASAKRGDCAAPEGRLLWPESRHQSTSQGGCNGRPYLWKDLL